MYKIKPISSHITKNTVMPDFYMKFWFVLARRGAGARAGGGGGGVPPLDLHT